MLGQPELRRMVKELVVLVGTARALVRIKECHEPVHVEPLDRKSDDHVEIHIDLASRVERNIGRLKIVPPCRIPYVVSCPPGIPGVFTSDHTSYSFFMRHSLNSCFLRVKLPQNAA